MIYTILLAIVLLAGIGILIGSRKVKNAHERRPLLIIGAGITLVALVMTGFGTVTIVKPREIGVKVALGKPVGALTNGFHLKAPWESVERLDGAVQNDIYTGESAIPVRLGNNGKATVDASIQWILKDDDAMAVFLDYKTFAKIQSNLVDRNFNASLNEVMGTYDPLAYVEPSEGGQDLAKLAEQVKAKMQKAVGVR